MPDRRRHRGSHPEDAKLFHEGQLDTLRRAARDYLWLLGKGYSSNASLKLVGDRYQLHKRQRHALLRGIASPERATQRAEKLIAVPGADIVVDGLNVVLTVESLLSRSVLIRGNDGLIKDLASVHGNYRLVQETRDAVALISRVLQGARSARWLIDRPVSNSGRLAVMVREAGWEAETVDDVDGACASCGLVVATSDGPLADRCTAITDLISPLLADASPWLLDLHGLTEGPGTP